VHESVQPDVVIVHVLRWRGLGVDLPEQKRPLIEGSAKRSCYKRIAAMHSFLLKAKENILTTIHRRVDIAAKILATNFAYSKYIIYL
jgi:hypothetical protein